MMTCDKWPEFEHEMLIVLIAELAVLEEVHGVILPKHIEGRILPLFKLIGNKEDLIFDIGFELVCIQGREDIDFDVAETPEDIINLYANNLVDLLDTRIKAAERLGVSVVIQLDWLKKINSAGQLAVCNRLAELITSGGLDNKFSIKFTDDIFLEDAYSVIAATTNKVIH